MHKPPPPIPIHNPTYGEVRPAEENPAREPSEIVRRAIEAAAKAEELAAELVKDKDVENDLSAELRAETARSIQDANRTVLDKPDERDERNEPDERRRSRTDRGR